MDKAGRGNPACPYLGLDDDAETSLAFPSGWNTCHRGRRVVSPNLEYQAQYCLGENHPKCTIFLTEQATLPLQYHLRVERSRTSRPRDALYRNLAFLLMAIVVLVGFGWFFLGRNRTIPIATERPLQTNTTFVPTAVTPTPAFTPTPIFTVTAVPISLSTSAIPSKRQLDQPVGSDYKFVIHKILYGENLGQLASRYNTSVDAILEVNYELKTPVWEDALVVIPVGFTNTYDLPAFEAYEVARANIPLDVLALSFGVSLKDLRYYNDVDVNESLQIGDWLLIPHSKPAP